MKGLFTETCRRRGSPLAAAATAALPALIANLAVEVAPVRVNLIAAGFVDTPLSASMLGKDLAARRDQLLRLPGRGPTLPGGFKLARWPGLLVAQGDFVGFGDVVCLDGPQSLP